MSSSNQATTTPVTPCSTSSLITSVRTQLSNSTDENNNNISEETGSFTTTQYFTKKFISEGNYGWQCNLCTHKPYNFNTSKNNLATHLTNIHSMNFSKQTQKSLHSKQVDSIDLALLFFMTFNFLSFGIVRNKHFIKFVHELNPLYELPDQKALNKLFNEIYDSYRNYTIEYLKGS